MKRYFSKGDWFDEGQEVEQLAHLGEWDAGLFRGLKNGTIDEEVCPYDEFIIIEEWYYYATISLDPNKMD